MPWVEAVPAILEAYYPGQEGGDALARILFGKVNPSGKLPETFPQRLADNPSYGNFPGDPDKVIYGEGIYVGYRHYDKKNIEPLFPFGFGLSYTDFSYSNLQIEEAGDKLVKATVKVKNTGLVPGKEVVQLYIRDMLSDIDKPEKELKGFTKVFLEPGQTKPVSITLTRDQFAYFDEQQDRWVVEPGAFEILVGSSSRDIRLRQNIIVE
jgi:beta-glucosidase